MNQPVWHVYVLRSLKNGRPYTGSTSDLRRRLAEHGRGKNRYVRYAGPFEPVYSEPCANRLEARRRELYLKSGNGRRSLEAVLREQVGD